MAFRRIGRMGVTGRSREGGAVTSSLGERCVEKLAKHPSKKKRDGEERWMIEV